VQNTAHHMVLECRQLWKGQTIGRSNLSPQGTGPIGGSECQSRERALNSIYLCEYIFYLFYKLSLLSSPRSIGDKIVASGSS
jgi:hypothetical protein